MKEYREVYSLLPGLSSEIGHLFHYHLAVQRALHQIGWKYVAFVPQKTVISPLPSNWIHRLANDRWDGPKGILNRAKIFLANIVPFFRIFQSIRKKDTAIVFLEHFELQHLASICVALFLVRSPQFHFWILHRFVFGKRHFKTFIYRAFHWYLEKKLGKENVRYLTDSDLLAKDQKRNFRRLFSVVPIPHTQKCEKERERGSFFFLWWPGGSIRESKGLLEVQHLIKLFKAKPEMRLVLAEVGKPLFSDHGQILFVPTILPREEYLNWMKKADLVLLPYSPKDYSHRTSGVFVETICVGTIPVTTKGTWMAYELEKFGLSELIFSWQEKDLLTQLSQLPEKQEMLEKLAKMRSKYLAFHSEGGFSSIFRKL